ncbi:MAG: bifunctional DNA-formamidopyrimidine glycosylase/DNA-(apurinic or apyrimidinic site) lyase [Candidatus Acidiferrales bacterium]
MPELPEVETVVRGLRPRLVGRRIVRLVIRQPAMVRSNLKRFRRALAGARIAGMRRRGKYILIELARANGRARRDYWVVHLGMTGQLYAAKRTAPLEKHTHLIAWLSSGEQLRYRDARRFGRLLALRADEVEDYFAALGPEPLRISLEGFRRLFAGRRAPVKNLLLNQNRLRGVGNIYAGEALFLAGVHPARAAASLSAAELERLYRALREVLRDAIAGQGSTVSDYRRGDGLPGDYQNSLRVYDREGEPCPNCGEPIERLVLAGRSAHFCPRCQPVERMRPSEGRDIPRRPSASSDILREAKDHS